MRDRDVPVKTAAGRRELGERRHALNPRQRSLLIAIHGEQTLLDLRRQFQALGDVDALLDELHDAGLIEAAGAAEAEAPAPTAKLVAAIDTVPEEVPEDAATATRLARQFMNETTVAVLGLRAFLFTKKLQRCGSAEDLRALLPEYRRMIGKVKSAQFAEAVALRAASLLAKA